MTNPNDTMSIAAPPPGYYISLGLAYASLAILAMALSVSWSVAHGLYPEDNIGKWGSAGLVLGFCIVYADRSARWPRLPSRLRSVIKYLVFVVLWLSVGITCFALYTSLTAYPDHCAKGSCGRGLQLGMTIMATLCQAGTLSWLLYYGRRG